MMAIRRQKTARRPRPACNRIEDSFTDSDSSMKWYCFPKTCSQIWATLIRWNLCLANGWTSLRWLIRKRMRPDPSKKNLRDNSKSRIQNLIRLSNPRRSHLYQELVFHQVAMARTMTKNKRTEINRINWTWLQTCRNHFKCRFSNATASYLGHKSS